MAQRRKAKLSRFAPRQLSRGREDLLAPKVNRMSEEMERFAVEAARQAGAILALHREAGSTQVTSDGPDGPVTTADVESERAIRSTILAVFPSHRVLSEEDMKERGLRSYELPAEDYRGHLWIVDPLDGTANYARGSERAAVSIAFAIDGVVQAGAVHAPFLQVTYSAARGHGARRDGVQIRARDPVSLGDSIVGTGLAHRRDARVVEAKRFERLIVSCRDIRRTGCPSLDIVDVATGVLDAHTEDLAAWDVAAAGLIAKEAGADRFQLSLRPAPCPEDLLGLGFLVGAPGVARALMRALAPGASRP
jgi:myo-inositol-1(or 4)-monophosphatase